MPSLSAYLLRRFSRLVRDAVKGGRSARPPARRRSSLGLEWLESREVFSVNPVVAENQLPGTPQSVWDVPGAGDATIQGFATDISVNQGQTVNFKINDTARAPYHLDIYRLGYYGGAGARKVATVPSSQTTAVVQPAAKFDPNTALVDAGNWSVTASWSVPATATSGVYFARVTRDDTGGAFMILFVVRNDAAHSQVLFQTADATWEAYNTWGGYSLYQATGGTQGPGYGGAAYAVSYNRPLINRGTPGGLGDTNNFFYDEYPMVRWLEANGYDVGYFTNLDADRNGSLIQNHQVFLAAGHDEYWSGNQFNNVMAARDAGVNLAFFTGNEVFWKTYYAPSIDGSNTPNRTLVDYKETHANAIIDPNNPNVWTGTWMDPRFSPPADGGRPQNQLTGTLFTVNRGADDTGTPFTVPYAYSKLRFWRNTSVATLQPGQTATLGDYELGYEWDEDVDNGFRPAGLIDLSSTTQNVTQKFIDYGNTTAPGVATHSLTLYRAKSGALVFGAGTVQYDWGLDGYHDGASGQFGLNSTPVLALQQATVNLLADMYVQPGTLQPGLVAATASNDVTAPTSTVTSPVNGASLRTGTAVTITGTASDSGGGIVGGVEVSVDGGHTWHPAVGTTNWSYTWVPDTPGQITVMSRAADDSGNIESPKPGVTVTVSFQPTSRTGLVAEFGFNDGTGTTLTDSSGNHNNGTISSATWSPGLFGQALSFNGTNSWVTIPSSASLNLTTGMTLEAWVKPAALTDWGAVIMKERTGGLSYAMYADNGAGQPPSGYVHIGTSDNFITGGSALPLNTWSHLAATYDGSNLDIYVNGYLAGTLGMTGALTTSTGALRIGGNSIWGEFFNGLIDEIRVYNRALNQAEIRSDMSTAIGGSVDSTPPTASLTGPAAGATLSGTATLSATASDNVVVTGVQFLLDGQPLGGLVTAAPYTLSWDTRRVANGTHVLSARAVDGVGLATTSGSVTVTVNNPPDATAPTVRITNLSSPASASGITVLSAVASDNIAVTGVQFQLNGVNIGPLLTAAPYRFAWDASAVADGTYTLTAVAQDAAGNRTASGPITITIDHTPPTVLSTTPAANATGVNTTSSLTVGFSESVQPGTIAVTLRDPSGNAVPLTVSYDDATHTATLSHGTIALDPLTTYTATVSGVKDLAGNAMAAPFSWSFSTGNAIVGATIWTSSTVPSVTAAADPSPIEVGVKFRADVAGTISGLRFFQGSGNSGTHVGHLWTAAGQLLATVTFTGETGFGWQQANFSTPVAITANTTYVASYYAPNGDYAADGGYFATAGVNSGPLHALADGADGPNGVYHYGTGGGFPTDSFSATNYWVDVVFNSTTQGTTPPTVTGESPAPGATGVAQNTAVTVTFSKAVQAGTINFVLKDAAGNTVPAAVSYNASTNTATLTPNAALASAATYTATVSGATDLSGNVLAAPFSWSFTTVNASAPPAVTAVTPASGATGVPKGTAITATFSKQIDDTDPAFSFVLTDSAGNVIPSTVSYDDEASIATLTPNAALAPATTYTATVSGVKDLAGNAMAAPVSWSFTTAFAVTGNTIWNPSAAPTVPSANDPSPVELGLKFQSDVGGTVTALRFYKGAGNTGTHVGHLWTASGTLLASATFTNESASGWQQVSLSSPVTITPGTTYVVSYYAPAGHYAADGGTFATAGVDSPPLHALANGPAGGNGVYKYATGGGFPTDTFNATNYWVDVVFSPVTDTTPPTVTAQTPAAGTTGVAPAAVVTATFSEPVQAGTVSFVLKDAAGNAVAATLSYDPNSQTATLTPSAALQLNTTYTATVSGAKDLAGNTMTAVSWSFTTAANVTSSLWGPSAAPAVASANDAGAVELGVKFTSSVAGTITGVRFYKGAGNTGTHVGHLWAADGTLLATVTFTGESASGWQQANFSSPVAVTAGATYVVSYYAPAGGYSYTSSYFATAYTAGPLTAPAGANGVYRYGTGGGFPTGSFNSTNYWVDVVFSTAADTTPPTVTARTPASGATGVPLGSALTAVFSEAVQAGTVGFTLTAPGGAAVSATLSYDPNTHTATLTPAAPLAANAVYTATVSGAKDLAGNAMSTVSWSFTTEKLWLQTSSADFGTGTQSGTATTATGNGGLSLASAFRDDFTGTSLDSTRWTTASWTSSGGGPTSVTVSGGLLKVLGGQVISAQPVLAGSVEGQVSFAAQAYQHFGLATGLASVSGNSWAMFSTSNTTNTLFARVNVNGSETIVSLGALPAGLHDYKVVPTGSGYQFLVDGALLATVAGTIPSGTPLKAVASDFAGDPARPLTIDWVQFQQYPPSGSFVSTAFDAGSSATWGVVNWTATVPAGTTMVVETSTSNDQTTWSNWTAATNGGTVASPAGRYIRYRVTFTTTNEQLTPELLDLSIRWA